MRACSAAAAAVPSSRSACVSNGVCCRYLNRCRIVFSGCIPKGIESSIPLFSGYAPSPLTPTIYRVLVMLSNRNVGVRRVGVGLFRLGLGVKPLLLRSTSPRA